MKIPYALRSKFTNACKESIVAQQEALSAGQTIHILLEAKGYPGKIKVTVYPGNLIEFGADWAGNDPTRFPARIKAGATALRKCGITGNFTIAHENGGLSITKMA